MKTSSKMKTFSCKDDCTLTKHTRRGTYSALRYFFKITPFSRALRLFHRDDKIEMIKSTSISMIKKGEINIVFQAWVTTKIFLSKFQRDLCHQHSMNTPHTMNRKEESPSWKPVVLMSLILIMYSLFSCIIL